MTEERALSVVEGGQLARTSPMDALATMSDAEFAGRLAAVKRAQQRMATIQREIMEPDVDYGVIPGTGNKPTLLKAGAEKLCKFHHLVPTFTQQTILGDGVTTPHLRILSTCSLHLETEDGPIVAQGVGAANSWEKKYRYRDAQRACPKCGAAAIFRSKFPDKNGRRGWYCFDKRGGCGAQFDEADPAITEQQQGQIENPDPFDGENTLEKMSAKRAQTDATLRATATSGLFTQDIEDIDQTPAPAKPQPARPEPARPAAAPRPQRAEDPKASTPSASSTPAAQTAPAGPSGPTPTTATASGSSGDDLEHDVLRVDLEAAAKELGLPIDKLRATFAGDFGTAYENADAATLRRALTALQERLTTRAAAKGGNK